MSSSIDQHYHATIVSTNSYFLLSLRHHVGRQVQLRDVGQKTVFRELRKMQENFWRRFQCLESLMRAMRSCSSRLVVYLG